MSHVSSEPHCLLKLHHEVMLHMTTVKYVRLPGLTADMGAVNQERCHFPILRGTVARSERVEVSGALS